MENLTPIQCYQRDLDTGAISPDRSQLEAVRQTQSLYEALVQRESNTQGLLQKVLDFIGARPASRIRGLYLWGGVGRGKTWIVDVLYDCLPFDKKMRMHFNRFMRMVHGELKALGDVQDPLSRVAEKIAAQARVVCFDEFHVSDITDAMLLGGLLKALFELDVVLVTTSNQHPDELYSGGLQRERFLPAIALLHEHTRIQLLDSDVDYRLRYLEKAEIYHHPLDQDAEASLEKNFENIAPDSGSSGEPIYIEYRDIPTRRCADGVVWFDFSVICEGNRGPGDYIEIARLYQTVLISGVPCMDDSKNDAARRFITLVDEFYDRNVKLLLSAAAASDMLYTGRGLAQAFERTASRLVEMQSHEYLSRQHLSD